MSRVLLVLVALVLAGCDHNLTDPAGVRTPPPTNDYGPAGAPPALGASQSYAVLAGAGVNCSGSDVFVSGDVGTSPNGAINNLPKKQPANGDRHVDDASAQDAQTASAAAYTDLAARPANARLTGTDLGGKTLTGGVYAFDADAVLTGTLVLDAENNPDAVFVFQVGNWLTCTNASSVALVRGAQTKNVFWQVAGYAMIQGNARFRGTLIVQNSVTCFANSSVGGRVLARNGTVTLLDCSVDAP